MKLFFIFFYNSTVAPIWHLFFLYNCNVVVVTGNAYANANNFCMLLIYRDWNWAHDGTKATETYKLWTWQQMFSTKLRRWTVEWFFGIDNRQRKFASFDVFVFEYESIVFSHSLCPYIATMVCVLAYFHSPFLFRHCAFGQLFYWQCHLDAITWCHSEYHQLLTSLLRLLVFSICKINGTPIFISIFFNWLYKNELKTPD